MCSVVIPNPLYMSTAWPLLINHEMCSVVIPNPLYTMYLVFGTDIYIAAYSRYHGIETMLSSETAHSALDGYLLPQAEQDYIILAQY